MLGRLRQVPYAGGPGAIAALGSGGPILAYAAPAAAGGLVDRNGDWPTQAINQMLSAPAQSSDLTFWAQGVGAWGRINSDGNAADLTRNLGGVFTGFDGRFALPAGRALPIQSLWLFCSHRDEPLGRHDNSVIPLELTHDRLDFFPHRFTFDVAHLLENWPHLREGIPSMLHRCGKRRELLRAWHNFHGHLTEAGLLEYFATYHPTRTFPGLQRVPAAIQHDDEHVQRLTNGWFRLCVELGGKSFDAGIEARCIQPMPFPDRERASAPACKARHRGFGLQFDAAASIKRVCIVRQALPGPPHPDKRASGRRCPWPRRSRSGPRASQP